MLKSEVQVDRVYLVNVQNFLRANIKLLKLSSINQINLIFSGRLFEFILQLKYQNWEKRHKWLLLLKSSNLLFKFNVENIPQNGCIAYNKRHAFPIFCITFCTPLNMPSVSVYYLAV